MLKDAASVCEHNAVFKESLILIQQVFVEEDPSVLIEQFQWKLT